jgi:hypothetical protein
MELGRLVHKRQHRLVGMVVVVVELVGQLGSSMMGMLADMR